MPAERSLVAPGGEWTRTQRNVPRRLAREPRKKPATPKRAAGLVVTLLYRLGPQPTGVLLLCLGVWLLKRAYGRWEAIQEWNPEGEQE